MSEWNFSDWATAGLMAISYLFILTKSCEWLVCTLLRQWDKRRQRSKRDMALTEFCAVFNVDEMAGGTNTTIKTTDGITIVIIKPEA